jgi:predicted permease
MLQDLIFRIRALFRRGAVEQELDQELRWHLVHLENKLMQSGMAADEARRQAHLSLGGVEQTKEACRDARGTRLIEDLLQDLRYAFRTLGKRPAFLMTAVLSLALGIGANTVVFGVVNALLLHPLDVPEPERIVAVNGTGGPGHSFPNYRDIRERNTVFEGLYAYRIAPLSLHAGGAAQRVWGLIVTGSYFETLGLRATVGRLVGPEEDREINASPYAVLSYECWKNRFGGEPSIAGKTIRINQLPYTVLGIAQRGFYGTDVFYRSEIWVPMSMQPQIEGRSWLDLRSDFNAWIGGRLKSGVKTEQANANLRVIAAQLAREHRENDGLRLSVSPPGMAGATLRDPAEAFAGGVMLLAVLVLLAACANLANLLTARAADRERELSIRVSIGAGQGRIARQLLTEVILISVLGGVVGMLLAKVLLAGLSRWRAPLDFPVQMDVAADWRVLPFSFGLAILTGLVFGLAPARRAWQTDPNLGLKGCSAVAARRRGRFREVLLAMQVALCALLVTASLVSVRGLMISIETPLGFRPQGVAVAGLDLGLAGYTEHRGLQFQRRLLDEVAALPGVTTAAYSNSLPLSVDQSSSSVYREDATDFRPKNSIGASYYMVSPGYFTALGTKLLAGREFTFMDRSTEVHVAIVNQTFARRLFGTPDAIGKRFRQRRGPPIEVVGVVEDGKYVSLTEDQRPAVFWPALQRYNDTMVVIARSTRPADELANEMRQLISRLDPELPVHGAGSVSQMLGFAYFPAYAAVWALGVFGGLAVMLACTGIYGLSSFVVSRRVRELGIRRAVGAQSIQILRSVFGGAAAVLVVGATIGLTLAVVGSRVLASIVYGASSSDPVVLGGAMLMMAGVGVVSAIGPARRALSVEPVQALRQD